MQKGRVISYILIIFIILGIFLRFYNLSEEYLWSDESLSMISAIKIHQQDLKTGIMYFQEHPGLGKWLVALPVNFISANYSPLGALGPNMFAWSYLAFEAVSENYLAIRIMNALIGVLGIIFVFLITKKLFNQKAALWGAAIMAISPDMMAYSRHEVLMKIISITTVLAAIFFYIMYLTEKEKDKKWVYLGATIISVIFALGSRNFDPLFIVPTIILSQFFVKRGKENLNENLIVTGLLIAVFLFVFYYTYPPEAKMFAQERLEAESPLQLIGFTFPAMAYHALIRNSYLTTISFLLIFGSIFYYLKKRDKSNTGSPIANIYKLLKKDDAKSVLPIFLLISFLGIGFTRLGTGHMYNITFYAAVFLLAGVFLYHLTKKYNILSYIFLLIILINVIQIIPNFPYSTWDYSNFNLGRDFYENKVDKTIPDEVFRELEIKGNPLIDSSVLNIMVFYKGNKIPMAVPNERRCTEAYFKELISADPIILHRTTLQDDPYICPFYRALPLKEVRNFENQVYMYEIDLDKTQNE